MITTQQKIRVKNTKTGATKEMTQAAINELKANRAFGDYEIEQGPKTLPSTGKKPDPAGVPEKLHVDPAKYDPAGNLMEGQSEEPGVLHQFQSKAEGESGDGDKNPIPDQGKIQKEVNKSAENTPDEKAGAKGNTPAQKGDKTEGGKGQSGTKNR